MGIFTLFFGETSNKPSYDFYWYLEHITIIFTIPLAVAGFGFTLWQIHKTRTVAEAARDAASDAQCSISRGTLLLLIPQLHHTEEELERAIDSGEQSLVLSWLATWRWQAGQLRGLLRMIAPDERDMRRAIQASIVATVDVRTELIGVQDNDLATATKDARTTIATVTSSLGELAVTQGMQIGQTTDD